MADQLTYYSQFDGQDVGGKRYALGEAIDSGTPLGLLSILTGMGKVATTKPNTDSGVVIVGEAETKPVANMNRPELERAAINIMSARVGAVDDDTLRRMISEHQAAQAEGDPEGDAHEADDGMTDNDDGAGEGEGDGGADDKPLSRQTTAELTATAEREGVTFGEDVKTNPDRVAAIEAAREEKARASAA